MNYKKIIEEVVAEVNQVVDCGEVASYIPELAKISPDKFGIHFIHLNGASYGVGDNLEKFSIQSIAKVLTLSLVFDLEGDNLWTRVGVEPSGSSFNSIIQLEYEKGIPRNPFINSGAIVVCDMMVNLFEDPKADFLNFVRRIADSDLICYNENVALSEKRTGFKNSACINLMKSFGNIVNDIDTVLDLYYSICSIEMTCEELAKAFLVFANNGIVPSTHERILCPSHTKRINAVMQTCGFYDEAGEFSFRVGLPGKSGVGGGIIAIHPHNYSIAVWSPKLNKKGNSLKGIKTLELFTTKSEQSIF
jgi:glutaminase